MSGKTYAGFTPAQVAYFNRGTRNTLPAAEVKTEKPKKAKKQVPFEKAHPIASKLLDVALGTGFMYGLGWVLVHSIQPGMRLVYTLLSK